MSDGPNDVSPIEGDRIKKLGEVEYVQASEHGGKIIVGITSKSNYQLTHAKEIAPNLADTLTPICRACTLATKVVSS